MNVNKH